MCMQLLLVACYGFPGDLQATMTASQEVLEVALTFGGRLIISGDFNATQAEGVIPLSCTSPDQ